MSPSLVLAARIALASTTWMPRPGPGADAAGLLVEVRERQVLALAVSETARGVARRDPATGAWSPGAPLPRPRVGYDALVLRGGDVLVVGGGEASTYDRSAADTWRYDLAADQWRSVAALPVARLGQAAARLSDGRVVVAGGSDVAGAVLARVDVYDPISDRWTRAADLGLARTGAVALPLARGGLVVHGGDGRDAAGQFFLAARFERWDPRRDRWRGGEAQPRHAHAGLVTRGTGLVAGGNADFGEWWGVAAVERFDPAANVWTTLGQLGEERSLGPVLVALPDRRRVVVVGGLLDTVEVFDLRRGRSTPAAPLPPDFGPALTGLAIEGRAFVVNARGDALALDLGR